MKSLTTLKNKILSILTLGVVSLGLALPAYGNTMSHLIASDPTLGALKDTESTSNAPALIHKKFLGAIAQNRSIPNTDGNCFKVALAAVRNQITNEIARQFNINMKKAATFLTDYDMAHDVVSYFEGRKDIMANKFGTMPFLAYYNEPSLKFYVADIYNVKKRKLNKHHKDLDYKAIRKLMFNRNLTYIARKLDETDFCATLRP